MIRRPPRSTRTDTLFPYTTLFRSFNVRYCVANAIVRKSSRLEHFTNEAVTDPTVGALAARIETRLDPALMEGKFENASRATVAVHLKDGRVLRCEIGRASCRERVCQYV